MGGPEDGYVTLVADDIDELRIESRQCAYLYSRTNAFSGRRRIYQHVYVERIWPATPKAETDPRATG